MACAPYCTGGAGLPEKAFIMATFRGDKDMFTRPQRKELADLTMDEEMCQPVNTSVLAATAAAQCGISSDKCHRCYRIGTPANLYDLVQEMGRTDRFSILKLLSNLNLPIITTGRRRNQLLNHLFSTWHTSFVHCITMFPCCFQTA